MALREFLSTSNEIHNGQNHNKELVRPKSEFRSIANEAQNGHGPPDGAENTISAFIRPINRILIQQLESGQKLPQKNRNPNTWADGSVDLQRRKNKWCNVCGNRKGVCHYYGADACGACKPFFRRESIGHKYMRLSCTNKSDPGACALQLTENNYNKCKFCRYLKCLRVGMRLEPGAARGPKRNSVKVAHREMINASGTLVAGSVESAFEEEEDLGIENLDLNTSSCPEAVGIFGENYGIKGETSTKVVIRIRLAGYSLSELQNFHDVPPSLSTSSLQYADVENLQASITSITAIQMSMWTKIWIEIAEYELSEHFHLTEYEQSKHPGMFTSTWELVPKHLATPQNENKFPTLTLLIPFDYPEKYVAILKDQFGQSQFADFEMDYVYAQLEMLISSAKIRNNSISVGAILNLWAMLWVMLTIRTDQKS